MVSLESEAAAEPWKTIHTNTTPRLVAMFRTAPAFDRRCGHCENRRTVCANVREPSRMALFIPELLHALLHSADSGTLRAARNRGRSIQIWRCPLEESNLPQPVKRRVVGLPSRTGDVREGPVRISVRVRRLSPMVAAVHPARGQLLHVVLQAEC